MSNDPNSEPSFNPYGPSANAAAPINAGPISLPPGMQRGMVGQVPIVGVLMIVQGVFDTLAGIIIAGYAVFMPMFFEEMQRQAAAQGNQAQQMPPNFGVAMQIAMSLGAIAIFAIGVLTIFCGVRVIQYRSRTFSIVMLCAGMATIATCYCFPTSIALAVYGLVVLLNSPVRLAFDLRNQGHEVASIQRSFLSIT